MILTDQLRREAQQAIYQADPDQLGYFKGWAWAKAQDQGKVLDQDTLDFVGEALLNRRADDPEAAAMVDGPMVVFFFQSWLDRCSSGWYMRFRALCEFRKILRLMGSLIAQAWHYSPKDEQQGGGSDVRH